MKKIKLMLVAFMAMVGVNAFADDTEITAGVKVSGTDGKVYSPVVSGKSPLKYTITKVMDNDGDGKFKEGFVSVQENGTEMNGETAITIPPTVSIPIEIGGEASTQSFKVVEVVAFTPANSDALASVTFGSNVTKIDASAFKGVATLATVTFGGAETEIGESAFEGTIISALTLPSTLETIGVKAFTASTTAYPTFSTLSIPASVKTIGTSAFEGCENLATVTLAASSNLYAIGDGAFAYTSLTELNLSNATEYNPTPADPTKKEGMKIFGTEGTEYGPFTSEDHKNTSLVKKVVLPTTCATIKQYAFANVQYLEEIDLKNVKTIETCAFSGCKNLTAAAIGTTIAADDATGITLGANAFNGCAKLATVEVGTIKAGVIADNAFGNAPITTFKFNTIAGALGTTAWNLATVTTLYFQKYIGATTYIPASTFTLAFGGTDATLIPADADYNIYYSPEFPDEAPVYKPFNVNAFAADGWTAEPVIKLSTASQVQAAYGATLKKVAIEGGYTTEFTIGKGTEGSKVLIEDTKHKGNYYYYYQAPAAKSTIISKEQKSGANVTVYQAYTDGVGDEVDIYFMPLQVKNGKYIVSKGAVVIIKSNKVDAVAAAPGAEDAGTMIMKFEDGKILNDLKITDKAYSKLAVMSSADMLANGSKDVWFFNNPATSGFGFTKYDSSKQNGLSKDCVYLQTAVSAAARVNIIWLDEEGNTTAIQKIEVEKTAANNGAIYNVAGQKVSASYKGLVIKDGKKYIQK